MQTNNRVKCLFRYIIIMILGIGVNLSGKYFASHMQLPLWLDSIGTGIVACALGPLYGAICGGINNVIYGLHNSVSYIYAITNIIIGLIMGISCKRGAFKQLFNAMTVSVVIALTSMFILTPLNIILWDGFCGNIWGNALYSMLKNYGWNSIMASAVSELFVDLPDKVVMILITFYVIKIPYVSGTKYKSIMNDSSTGSSGFRRKFSIFFILLSSLIMFKCSSPVMAAEYHNSSDILKSNNNFSSYSQTVYNNDNGLTAGEANYIVETLDGYIWIGTYAGLYRYDGSNFTLMKFDSVKNVNRLYLDTKGRLWIGTNDKGVSVYENGEITDVIDKNCGLSSNSVRCISEDNNGNYYIGTSSSLCIISDKKGLRVEKTIPDVSYANNISIDPEGTFSIITNSGDLFFMSEMQVIGRYNLALDGVDYTSCTFDKVGNLYIATSSNTIYQWDFTSQSPDMDHVIDTGSLECIHSMYEDEEGLIWVCSDSGIGYVNNNQCVQVKTGSFSNSIDKMLKDYQGNLWFTSSRLGVLKLTHNSFNNIYNQCELINKIVNSVVMWNGFLYSGTDTGLDIIDLNTKTQINNNLTNILSNNRIRCLYVDSKNNLWISTSDGIGLVQVSPNGETSIYRNKDGTIGERFRSTLELSDGTIVAAENTGLDFIRCGKVYATIGAEDGLTNPQILSLAEKNGKTLYAGSDGDGIMVIQDGMVVDKITEEDGLPSGVILRMLKVLDGYVIVTSNSLCYMDNTEKIVELKQFPYSNNYDIISSKDGKLWVLGSAGIYIVNQDELLNENKLKYELLDGRKGLKSSLTANSWNYVDGRTLYFSTNSGVFSIDMSNYTVYTGDYRMMVDYVDSDNNSYSLSEDKVTEIPKDITRITIHPELLNYTLNDPYICYYLEGVDEKEYVVQQSMLDDIVYSNLPEGEYIFHMSVLDNSGDIIVKKQSYSIIKQPQFWEHEWFYAYFIFVCILGIVYVTWMFAVLHSRKIIEKQKGEIEFAKKEAVMGNETIIAIAKAVDAKDVNTSRHSERVSEYSVMIARKLGWTSEQCESLRKNALLHDIGKIGIPDSILKKPSRLTDEEYSVMKSHVIIGSRILKDFTIVDNVQDGVKYHHERYDGNGYVEGLKGEQIPKNARIIGLADAFDAMTSNRVYRKRMNMDYVIDELKKGSGTQFDPQLVSIMLDLIEDGSIKTY